MEGEETVFFSFIVRKVYCPVSVLQAAHHFSVVFNQCFGGGKEEPRQFLPFQSGFNARAPQFGILSLEMVPSLGPPHHPTASPQARGGRLRHSTAELEEPMLRYLKPRILSPARRQRDVLWSSATVVPGAVQMAAVWLPGAKRNLHKLQHTPSSKSK